MAPEPKGKRPCEVELMAKNDGARRQSLYNYSFLSGTGSLLAITAEAMKTRSTSFHLFTMPTAQK
jgi:hypothetical protein